MSCALGAGVLDSDRTATRPKPFIGIIDVSRFVLLASYSAVSIPWSLLKASVEIIGISGFVLLARVIFDPLVHGLCALTLCKLSTETIDVSRFVLPNRTRCISSTDRIRLLGARAIGRPPHGNADTTLQHPSLFASASRATEEFASRGSSIPLFTTPAIGASRMLPIVCAVRGSQAGVVCRGDRLLRARRSADCGSCVSR